MVIFRIRCLFLSLQTFLNRTVDYVQSGDLIEIKEEENRIACGAQKKSSTFTRAPPSKPKYTAECFGSRFPHRLTVWMRKLFS